jgi:hypothetical protein
MYHLKHCLCATEPISLCLSLDVYHYLSMSLPFIFQTIFIFLSRIRKQNEKIVNQIMEMALIII